MFVIETLGLLHTLLNGLIFHSCCILFLFVISVAIVTLSLLLEVCCAITILNVVNQNNRLSVVVVQILVNLLLIFRSHFHVENYFQCFRC